MTTACPTYPGMIGVDTDAKLGPASAGRLTRCIYAGRPVEFVFRYVSLDEAEPNSDATGEEIEAISNAGLHVGLVQHCRFPGWTASANLGTLYGERALTHAQGAGYPSGCHLALDLEGCSSVGQPVIDYVQAWAKAVVSFFPVLLYVGYAAGLTPDQLYYDLPDVHLYWSDYGPRAVSVRGFAAKQLSNTIELGGVGVDPDRILGDLKGATPVLMSAA